MILLLLAWYLSVIIIIHLFHAKTANIVIDEVIEFSLVLSRVVNLALNLVMLLRIQLIHISHLTLTKVLV